MIWTLHQHFPYRCGICLNFCHPFASLEHFPIHQPTQTHHSWRKHTWNDDCYLKRPRGAEKYPHLLSHIIHPHFNWTCTASINIQHFSPHFILSTLRPIAKWNVRSVLCCQRRPVAAGWINREGTGKRNIGEEKSISHFARPGMPSSTWGLFIYKSPNKSAL